jgi:hypothetical protein
MALNKEKVQDLIDDFVVSNVEQINEVATANPMVYDAVINALNLLSRKFGTIQAINIPKPAAPIEPEKQKANALHPSVQMLEDFVDIKGNETRVGRIDYENEEVTFFTADPKKRIKLKFSVVNDAIEKGAIKLVGPPKLNPLIKVDEKFIDKNTKNVFIVKEIIRLNEEVRLLKWENKTNVTLDFSVINDLISRGDWLPYTQAVAPKLNPLVKIGAEFIQDKTTFSGTPKSIFIINDIDYDKGVISLIGETIQGTADVSFNFVNDKLTSGEWVPYVQPATQPQAPKLNALVDIGEVFEDTNKNGEIITITDIDYTKRKVQYDKEGLGVRDADFEQINGFIEDNEWVHKPSSKVIQSNTFGALTLNPSVQVGQKYIDLEDDSNFNVLLIDQKKQVVTINWNEDDIQGEVDFEDFNDNLQAATWVLAPDQAQGTATEDEILDAIEGLELIGDAISKKEIAELKKQLKQLKKKKP